jgi:hypothetical protein
MHVFPEREKKYHNIFVGIVIQLTTNPKDLFIFEMRGGMITLFCNHPMIELP